MVCICSIFGLLRVVIYFTVGYIVKNFNVMKSVFNVRRCIKDIMRKKTTVTVPKIYK